MTDRSFRTTMRGYDPLQVDRALAACDERVAAVAARLAEAEAQVVTLTEHVGVLEGGARQSWEEARRAKEALEAYEAAEREPATFTHLGERVGQILALAEREAEEIRTRVVGEADEIRAAAETDAAHVRADADLYAQEVRIVAEEEGAKLINEARKAADEERDSAAHDAAALRGEAEAIVEAQRASAAQAAADFETSLAARRKKATAEIKALQKAAKQELDAMTARTRELEESLQRTRAETDERIERMLSEAKQRAEATLADARATADRVRAESERELAAASQRRDSINSQLAHVRQMLATVSGGVSVEAAELEPEIAEVEEPTEVAATSDATSEPALAST
ncbi:hypothetical protein [Nocardioides seonyuensis]|uniref:hypothetical protein n=1 Tax=Nocardioides seonyuensis TaxID=2518371 RepID=UPI00141D94C7|nr:hypothetical protein [Nocardioides seonyuensis]